MIQFPLDWGKMTQAEEHRTTMRKVVFPDLTVNHDLEDCVSLFYYMQSGIAQVLDRFRCVEF